MTTRARIDVYCMTYGEPGENTFRPQFEYSLAILNRLTRRVAPIPSFITPILAARRARIRCAMFNARGYHSPLEPISEAQVQKIARFLAQKRPDIDWRCRTVTEFRRPFLPSILREGIQSPPDDLVILPLYLAESDFTTGISRTDLARFHRSCRGQNPYPAPAYVDGFGFSEELARVVADFVERQCEAAGWDKDRTCRAALILGAHGTLQFPPPGINSGAKETLYFFGLLRARLRHRFRTVRIAWLNHKLGGKWTFPAADETGDEVWNQGIREVVYFPFGFLADNNESQNEGRDALAKHSWEALLYLPCPNEDDAFCASLADHVLERIDDPRREAWDRIEQGGRRDLIQRERPTIPGPPGILSFNGPTLAAFGIVFWSCGAAALLLRAAGRFQQVDSTPPLLSGIAFAVLIGWLKGYTILARVMRRNLVRLRRLPQPSPVTELFSLPTWFLILFFMSLGVALRFLGLHPALYGAILGGVGLSLLYGVAVGIRSFHEATPHAVISMHEQVTRSTREGG